MTISSRRLQLATIAGALAAEDPPGVCKVDGLMP
jgi:hypothetical protein